MSQKEEDNVNKLQGERIRLKKLVKLFEDNNEEYLKIKKTVKEEVGNVLLDGKGPLRLAFYSLMESMRKDPEKYSALIHYANDNTSYSDQYYTSYFGNGIYPYQLSSDTFLEALQSMIVEDANMLYEQLLKQQVNQVTTNYVSNRQSQLLSTTPTNSQSIDINKGS
jgi:hypothetical protein